MTNNSSSFTCTYKEAHEIGWLKKGVRVFTKINLFGETDRSGYTGKIIDVEPFGDMSIKRDDGLHGGGVRGSWACASPDDRLITFINLTPEEAAMRAAIVKMYEGGGKFFLKVFNERTDGSLFSSHYDSEYPEGYKVGGLYSIPKEEGIEACDSGYHAAKPGHVMRFFGGGYGTTMCLVFMSGDCDESPNDKVAYRNMFIAKKLRKKELDTVIAASKLDKRIQLN